MTASPTPPTPTVVGPRLRTDGSHRALGGVSPVSETIGELLDVFATHHPGGRVDRIERAYEIANSAHAGAVRRSGDPYITHPIEVAEITADLGLDEASVVAALLHDVVEDTDITLEDLRAEYASEDTDFADDVVTLVDGLTKLDGLHFATEDRRRAADLRRLLAAIARDPRILVIKLSDRLHNMRTLGALPEHKRARIATETLEVYAPLAHRLGMGTLRSELEDLCFANLHPVEHAAIARSAAERRSGIGAEMAELTEQLTGALRAAGINAEVSWRIKHLWGIYSKMVRQRRTFDEIFDVVGVRVIVADEAECYAAIGIVHATWKPVPARFRDYLANVRFNGYRSLHTTVWGPAGRTVELQVRTAEMHEVAEYGVAAHWAYKESGGDRSEDVAEVAWMRRLLDANFTDDLDTHSAYVGEVTDDLARTEIYCLTPRGRVVALPEGATPIDFAYQVHTEIGDRAVGARVDGRQVGLDHRLNDGDRVEIITSNDENRGPNPAWAAWVATPRARQLIHRWHTRARRRDAADAGNVKILAAVNRRAARLGVPAVSAGALDTHLESIRDRWGLSDGATLAAAVGDGRVSPEAVAARIVPEPAPVPKPHDPSTPRPGVLVEGDADIEYMFAGCCDPHPPAQIVGWVTRGRGVSVHRFDCTNAIDLITRDQARIIGVEWAGAVPDLTSEVKVRCFDRPGLFAAAAAILARSGADIRTVSATVESGIAHQDFVVSVGGSTVLEEIETGLWTLDGVIDVTVTAKR